MMHKMILLVVGFLVLVDVGSAQITQIGQCETISLMQNFDLNSFATGTWYEVGKASAQNADCSNLQFTTNTGGTISVYNPSVVNNFLQTATGTATHTNGTAQLTLTLSSSTNPIDFWVLGSDYNNYAIVINCVNASPTQRTVNVWQLGRANNSYDTPTTLTAANAVLSTIGLSVGDLQAINHTAAACTQLPVIGDGQPVILEGQCDTASVPVVQNFDVQAFTGTWHEISSYYSPNAVGTCAKAEYTLVGSIVNVLNSQILNQRLDTISGNATLIGTDQSGRLNVTLDIQGILIAQELLIIDTDYTGYAVSYSCVNLANNLRLVNSWILSRTKQISTASQTEVNRVIASLIDLNDAYYIATDQSDTGCFYFPTYQPGVPVVFPGQCDDTIAALPSFSLNQFIGTWHEVEAYPKEQQTGTCVNHVFSTGTTTSLNLVSNQVVNQTAISASGNVTVVSSDGSARLNLTLTTGGETIQISYWILATDYTTYALAYSCENVDNEYRAVYSWKLSRTQSLPAEATTAINTAMAAVQVLDQQYFEVIDQTDAGCFYFPEAQAGIPVIFPGQCDLTVPVQSNFNPVEYMGLWHEIESYPSTFVSGTCSNAYYSLTGGVVDVYNTQVINQQLDTINGTATIPDASQPAKLLVSFPIAGTNQTVLSEYWVLATDYTSYSLVYTCTNLPNNQRLVFSWKLSRTKELTAAANVAINAVTANVQVLDSRYYEQQNQTADGCFYFPEPQAGVPVVFPGQCDNTIAAVPNFNLTQFVGTWHEVEAYPKEQQTGTCVNHVFSTGTTTSLNLVSNQVVNQTAISASGNVTVVSSDGSARLNLTLTTGGETIQISYWILATDYTTYALAYSCENVDNEYRAVYSWKLSRTQSLPAEATTAINTAMAAVQVLDQQYFEVIDQTDAGCFYFPEAQAGIPVIFPGQCDLTVPVQSNFNPVEYMGLWHEIESYPSTFVSGTCSNAYYSLTGGVVDVYNTQVINQQLDTINGTATIPDASQPAKLLVSFPIAGTNQTVLSEYWVLATDYTSYSLVYTCTNLPNNQRLVFSWKLSRTKELTAAANVAINAVTANVQVLDSRYYEQQNQTADGCFYFPEPQAGVPVVFPGQCDNTIAAVPNFNLTQFVGTWHEVEAYPKEQQTGTCVNHVFSTGTTTSLNLVSNQVVNQTAISASGNVTVVSSDGSARLNLTLTTGGETIQISYWILATDYTTYALAYSCENVDNEYRAVYSWKLSRTQSLPAEATTAINTAMAAVQVLDQQYFEVIDQTDAGCFYFPEAQSGIPVIFPGQCDLTVPVQSNFNPVEYMGLWHEIESYPSTFVSGTCSNAYYSLTGGVVDVYNTQVINQQLDTINGTATIPDASQTAKLLVSFPIAGTNQTVLSEYWVLATDYTSYSLVYTCTNLPNNQRLVFSWKLSRTKELTAAANVAINAVTANVQVLDSRYYEQQNQTADGCFYFPEPQAGVPVVFPGQCDNTIAAVPNFNLTQFVGTWHEVEAYPKEQQTGTCVNHVFSTGTTTTLNLVSNQVVNQTAISASGNVTVVSSDGSARLNLTLTTGGETIQISYWILATDYTTYALAYSCENVDNEYRAVYSWKLSRTQSLPAEATTAINTAMAAVQVLDQQYFEVIDQTDAGCFYFPEAQAGIPVIFPGQCDLTVPVQSNFNPVEYMGLWHEIESYPSTFVSGTCSNAYYSLTGGVVDVYNTQVINQQLDTINGTATIPDASQPAKLLVSFPIAGTNQTVLSEYWVLATDYTSYSLVYTCTNLPNNQRLVFSWKLSRTKELTAAANVAINAVTANVQVLDSRYYEQQNQTADGCFYFPEPQAGVPVVFPGQCDNTIAAVPNFNLAQFVGTWHEVEAYPKEQQTGTCVNHVFSTGTTTSLNLVSNQVVNQTAISASGNVTVVSSDGSARLNLTLTTGGETIQISYWILATDYTTYALAYSCENVDNEYRAVYSWKLSRTQSLPAEATTAINTAMAAVQVLDQQYFEVIDQTDAGCFYFPEAQAGIPVIFPGQCDLTVPVQSNFNPVEYMGLWHEIESYPSTFVSGTCSNAYYSLTGGVVDVYNTQVINQQLDTINGTATIPDASQPAKLLVSFPIAGTNQTVLSEYWVLATDYTSYSLVYTCTNLPNNQRLVFSWKLSRTKELTAAANVAINAVTANVQVLDSRYYEQQNQTADGCFYFPEPQAGVPVVFPGQCNDTIAAVPNFNLAQFVGTWHEVEAYPKEQQTGTCVNHVFTSGTTTTLNLVSNQVLDQILTSATGNATIVSTDGSGRLNTSLSVGGQPAIEFPWWILATDYTSYALVYSCANLNDDYRAVYSWKLSRTQSLPAAAVTPINNAIATVQLLDQQYFETVDQSEAGCFSYPDIPADDPIILEGQCGTVTPVANFQSAAFNGTWHEIARYASARQTGDCAASQFTSTTLNTFTLTQTIVYNEIQTVVSGTATLATDGSGTLTATLTDGATLTYTTTIYILDTDYTEFALLYSCENVQGTNNRQIYSWKLSRSQLGLSQAANDRISQVVGSNLDLVERYYQTTGQTSVDCFYYPVFEDTPESIILPGSCPTVSGVANFNPTNYLGEWYDVARYSIASHFGTCPRAEYSLVDGVITIRNTMVVNETLRVQNGIARLSSLGTGLLTVTFVLENGEESVAQYFILGTDYTSYSLVYSCRNLDDGTRQVFSWKLSRTPTLTAEANTAINDIINNTQGLNEDYYRPQNHTDQDCFYVPEPVPGESVIFRGGCNQVTGMQGFDASQYLGWWHEIERYPSDGIFSQCTSANFMQTSTNAIQVIESEVYNSIANETTNVAVLSANGTITITRNGVASTYIVIATDYSTYSLLYSCEEVISLQSTHRRVWSAKHSKQGTLSAAAVAAMAPYIEANPVLHQRLYESVNQSDSACFHYREDANEQVILRGQCDTNIPVQENFDLSRFAGTWYQIERYPYPQVSNDGTCVGTRYTVTATILNWEVLDGVLNTKEGTAYVNGSILTVTLPVEGDGTVTTDLLILSTDYEDFALAYTCVNIDAFQRRVGAFKLSRSRGLSNNGQYAIGTYMATREELHQPYFINISQHDDCEEPSSAFLFKSSIIVMLVCVVIQLVM